MNRYKALLELDNTAKGDKQREALFYIVANVEELYKHRDKIYDFKDNTLKADFIKSIEYSNLSSTDQAMYKIGRHFFNDSYELQMIRAFYALDLASYEIVKKVLEMTFEYEEQHDYHRELEKEVTKWN